MKPRKHEALNQLGLFYIQRGIRSSLSRIAFSSFPVNLLQVQRGWAMHQDFRRCSLIFQLNQLLPQTWLQEGVKLVLYFLCGPLPHLPRALELSLSLSLEGREVISYYEIQFVSQCWVYSSCSPIHCRALCQQLSLQYYYLRVS